MGPSIKDVRPKGRGGGFSKMRTSIVIGHTIPLFRAEKGGGGSENWSF